MGQEERISNNEQGRPNHRRTESGFGWGVMQVWDFRFVICDFRLLIQDSKFCCGRMCHLGKGGIGSAVGG